MDKVDVYELQKDFCLGKQDEIGRYFSPNLTKCVFKKQYNNNNNNNTQVFF